MTKRVKAPLSCDYHPEVDLSAELDETDAVYFQSLIGILRWIVELGGVDICCEVSMLSSCLALPREGHLQALFHIFSYLGAKHNAELVFDPSLPDIDYSCFPLEDWSDTIYADENDGQLGEAVPDDMPSSRELVLLCQPLLIVIMQGIY